MVAQSKKRDYEYGIEISKPKKFEIFANIDFFGRNIIFQDENYKISIDNFEEPNLIKLLYKSDNRDIKVGELVCTKKTYFNNDYIYINYVNVSDKHKGAGYSYRMMNCLLSILNPNIKGILSCYKDRIEKKPMVKLFSELGGYVNGFGYIEILNPKINVLK
jgi:hypothetical protein